MKKVKVYRDSVTGLYVSPEYAAANKATTQSETIFVKDKQIEEPDEIETQALKANPVFPSEVVAKRKI